MGIPCGTVVSNKLVAPRMLRSSFRDRDGVSMCGRARLDLGRLLPRPGHTGFAQECGRSTMRRRPCLCVLSVCPYAGVMAGAIAHEQAQHLRAALDEVLRTSPELSATALAAFGRLVDVLESNSEAVVFAADATVTTQQAAALLGVSRMTVVRLVDRGELTAEGAVHRRIFASELARYTAESSRRRRSAMAELANEIGEGTPPDQVIETR